ncbi:hypothetical protein SAMN05216198_1529 [Halopseudomonas litoralis]|uniref:Uncharacterized protein n=1 Tax=Halopseudomonas litoralis TaxID=797277 RepID=A0A1H1QMS2_9GAMM|nr:hypothetical protein [Halopseudomonas litoralis]SDS24705.1 hypothetical protein SAMN05216198_1529 [Halopseudomonas litoralis]
MSTFAVFGMTRGYAISSARRQVPTRIRGEDLTPEEWEAAVNIRADAIMNGSRIIQLCKPFDAPQFAHEFIRLMREQEECRDLCIRARAPKKDATGQPLKNKKTGAPVIGWQDWKAA